MVGSLRRFPHLVAAQPVLFREGRERGRGGFAGPVATLLIAILILWSLAAIWMNAPFARMQADNAGQSLSLVDIVGKTWSQERPVLPAPHQVLNELYATVFDVAPGSRRSLVYHSWITLSATLTGFAMGALFGAVLAVAIVHVTVLRKSLMPWIIASQTVPILAIAPIIIVVLGSLGVTGLLPKSLISAYLCFFPVTIGMVKGLNCPDTMQLDLMRTYNASRLQTFAKLRAPASLPFLFASLKVAIAIALVGAIVGELPTGAQAGLGARLLAGSYYGQTLQIWAALFAAGSVAGAMVAMIGVLERLVDRALGVKPEPAA